MRTPLIALSLVLLASPVVAQGYYGYDNRGPAYDAPPRARVWIDNDRDTFRRGERLRILFSTSADAYVAVIHIDPDGNLDFLYPESPLDRDFVQGGRTYSLPRGGFSGGELVRGRGGIGYLYIVASPVPLDYGYFRGRSGYGWDWSYAGQGVHGDPFWALEQITRTLVPDNGYVPYSSDYASYYVEGRPRYPSYACGGGYSGYRGVGVGFRSSWGYNPYYDSCDRLDIFLRTNPYYFDARRYRGDRRVVYRDYGPWQPDHGYKTAPNNGSRAVPRSSAGSPSRNLAPENGSARPAQPEARRPTLERRPEEPARQPETRPESPNRGRSAEPRSNPEPAPSRPARASGSSSGSSGGRSSPAPSQPARRRPGSGG